MYLPLVTFGKLYIRTCKSTLLHRNQLGYTLPIVYFFQYRGYRAYTLCIGKSFYPEIVPAKHIEQVSSSILTACYVTQTVLKRTPFPS